MNRVQRKASNVFFGSRHHWVHGRALERMGMPKSCRGLSSEMQNSYIRYGRRLAIPSTAQILDELKTGFVPGYVPISRGNHTKNSTLESETIDPHR
jgi:hypothetical protein